MIQNVLAKHNFEFFLVILPTLSLIFMKSLLFFLTSFFAAFTSSCSKDTNSDGEKATISNGIEISKLKQNGNDFDIIDILNSSSTGNQSDVQVAQGTDLIELEPDLPDFEINQKSNSQISDALAHSLDVNRDWEAEKALKKLEENVNEHQASINNLRKINLTKDQTIASLSTINDELLNEIKRIKAMGGIKVDEDITPEKPALSQIDFLKREVMKLKNTLILKSKELDNLRYKNDSLEGRISELEVSPKSSIYKYREPIIRPFDKQPLLNKTIERTVIDNTNSKIFPLQGDGSSSLEFDAVVTSLSGRNKEAFFTEFFILPISLDEALSNSGKPEIKLSKFKGISSYAELWAKSSENPYLYPNAQKSIRAVLLDLIQDGGGKRIRTDVDGYAKLTDLNVGNYFITGTATLGKVGVTWDVPVRLVSGNNKISLTLENSAWSL